MQNYKKDFPWFKNNPGYTYLDSSATALKPQIVIDEIVRYYSEVSMNSHNNDSLFTYQTSQKIDECRHQLAVFTNAQDSEIIFTSGATESLNLIANGIGANLKKGDQIIITYLEHASNVLPWYKLRDEIGVEIIFAGEKSEMPSISDFKKVINSKTKVVAFPSGSNLLGTTLDEVALTKYVKSYNDNIFTVVDCTQSMQHRPINLGNPNIDFAVCSAHKMFGPTGIGMAYLKKELQPKINPLRYGGGMNFEITEKGFSFMEGPSKYEGGTPNLAGIFGWSAAIKYFNSIGYDKIHKHEVELIKYLTLKLKEIDGIINYNNNIVAPTLAFNFKDIFSQDLSGYLGNKKIICRSGLSCAKLICNIIKTPAVVRASFYIYNNEEDVDKLIQALKDYKKGDEFNGII